LFILLLVIIFIIHTVDGTKGYWHQRADERHGNPPPR